MIIAMCICVCGFELKSEKEIVPDVSAYALSESWFIAESMMVAVDGDTNKFVSFSELYGFNRNLVAYCFNFEPSGYVIVNIGDYSISVMSAMNQTPYPQLNGDEGTGTFNGI